MLNDMKSGGTKSIFGITYCLHVSWALLVHVTIIILGLKISIGF